MRYSSGLPLNGRVRPIMGRYERVNSKVPLYTLGPRWVPYACQTTISMDPVEHTHTADYVGCRRQHGVHSRGPHSGSIAHAQSRCG